jgi:GT2 family glycosyltransferase
MRRKPTAVSRADRARDAGQWELAARLYRQALDQDPVNPPIWVQYAHALKESGELRDPDKLAQAELAYRRAVALDPSAADSYLQLGHVLKLQSRMEEAEAAYLRAAVLDGSAAEPLRELNAVGWSEVQAAELQALTRPQDAPVAINLDANKALLADVVQEAATAQAAVLQTLLRPQDAQTPFAGISGEPLPSERQRVGAIVVYGTTVTGWVWDPRAPQALATVEFMINGAVVHHTCANFYREDIKKAGFGSGYAGFSTVLPIDITKHTFELRARLAGTDWELDGSPRNLQQQLAIFRWMHRRTRVSPEYRSRLQARLDRETNGLLSIVMPIYNTKEEWLREAIGSIAAQWCSHWQLVCVNNGSTDAHVTSTLDEYSNSDTRIKVISLSYNHGIAGGTNAGIRATSGDLIAFMDSDDYLEPDAVYKYLKAHQTTQADLIYCDELITGPDKDLIYAVAARPAYSWDYYICHPYFVHLVCCSRNVLQKVGGWDESMQQSSDVDFVLRCQEYVKKIAHIPSVLYRWRTHDASAGHQMKEQVTPATLGALNRHLARVMPGAIARAGLGFNYYRVDFADDGGMVLVVVAVHSGVSAAERCLRSIVNTAKASEVAFVVVCRDEHVQQLVNVKQLYDNMMIVVVEKPSHFSGNCNSAIEHYRSRYGSLPPFILFINDGIEVETRGWLERIRSLARRYDIGVVGAMLLNVDDDTIYSAGVVVGANRPTLHAHECTGLKLNENGDPGYLGTLACTREYLAVSPAFMMTRSTIFDRLDGLDRRVGGELGGVDYCLQVGALGYKVIRDAHTVVRYRREVAGDGRVACNASRVFEQRWDRLFRQGDPYYSPLFLRQGPDHTVAKFSSGSPMVRVRPSLSRAQECVSLASDADVVDLRRWQTPVKLETSSGLVIDRPLGIFVHIFYDELIDEIAGYLAQIDLPKRIYISTKPKEKREIIQAAVNRHGLGPITEVAVVPDYGNDIAPFMITFSGRFKAHDVCLKIHSKRSFHSPRDYGDGWRSHLFHELMGDSFRVRSIVSAFAMNGDLGALIPQHYPRLDRESISIGPNYEQMQRILTKIGICLQPRQDIEFPTGSMFWFRGEALAAIADLGFDWADFGRGYEQDGALAHGMERSFLFFVAKAGMKWSFLPPFRVAHYASRDETIRLVRESRLFDASYYLRANPDIAAAGVDPLEHWVDFGWREWRNPSEDFDMEFYARLMPPQYPNAIIHYLFEGRALGVPTTRPTTPYPFSKQLLF